MSHSFAPPLSDPEYNQRIKSHPNFPNACKLTRILNAVGVGTIILPILIFALEVVNPRAVVFQILVILFIAVMPLSILLVYFFRGLVWYNVRSTVPNPSPFFGIFVAAIGLSLTGIKNGFVAYSPLFLWACPVAVLFWLGMLITTQEFKAYTKLDIANMGAMLFVCYIFSFGAYTASNCILDTSEPKRFPTFVTRKKMAESSRHDDSYWLYFSPVAGLEDTQTEVHASFYNSVDVNDTIQFNLNQGLWGSAWYYLEETE